MLKLNLIEPVVFHTRKLGVRFGIALRGGIKILPSFLRRTGGKRMQAQIAVLTHGGISVIAVIKMPVTLSSRS